MEIKRHYRPEKVKKHEARRYVEGKLKCRFFATEEEREQFITTFSQQITRNGTDLLLGFDPAKMRRWREASRLAPDTDPVEIVRFWLSSNRPSLQPKNLSEAIPAYVKYLTGIGRDPAYCKHVERHLLNFLDTVGDRAVHETGFQVIADYILNLPYHPVTKRHYRRALNGAYGWWIEQGWAINNPVKKVRTPEVIVQEPGILSAEDTAKLFRVNERIDPEICGLLALGAFAGLRTSAVVRLAYEELDFVQHGILTPAEKTKKKRRQWLEDLPENLWKWLARTPQSTFKFSERQFKHRRSEAYKRAGLLIEADDIARENRKREERGEPLLNLKPKCPPKNCFRHSFVTYHVALHRNPGKTALIVSHRDQNVLYQHYLGIATKEQAERYFAIVPSR